MAVFTDVIDAKHITIGASSNWALRTAALPNGDNAYEKTSQSGALTFGECGSYLDIWGVNVTLEFWIRPHSDWPTTGNTIIMYTANSAGGNPLMYVQTNGVNGTNALVYCSSNRGSAVGFEVAMNKWHLVQFSARNSVSGSVSSSGSTWATVDAEFGYSHGTGTNAFRPNGADSGCGVHLATPTTVTFCDLAKISWYNKHLSMQEIIAHYVTVMAV